MSTPGEDLALPIAAIVCLSVGSYLLLIGIIVAIRYCLVSRGVCECSCSCGKEDDDQQSCACCQGLAECCNCCKSPNITSCLDSICPNRKRMGCVEILLCQCCGSNGAAGVCNCQRCCACCKHLLCPCICDCNIDCSTISCCCVTVHIIASHDSVLALKHSHEQFHSTSSTIQTSDSPLVTQTLRNNNNNQLCTDLNKNVASSASLEISQNSSMSQDFNTSAGAQQFYKPAACSVHGLPYGNGAQYHNQSSLLSLSSPREQSCVDSATQTPRQFPVRRNTLRTVQTRKLKTARDRYTPREIKSARIARNVMFDPRLVHSDLHARSYSRATFRKTGSGNCHIARNHSVHSSSRILDRKGLKLLSFQDKRIHSISNVQH